MTDAVTTEIVLAAGGLVVRGDSPPDLQIALVHRPRYDDWSLPKGKNETAEDPATCALREVSEETGLRCRVVEPLGTSRYLTSTGPKQVDYFLMRPYRYSGFRPDDEVDQVRWLPPSQAAAAVSYKFDRDLITALDQARAASHTTVHLVRHAAAGNRQRWESDDTLRPLTPRGERQASALADELSEVGVSRILSSPYVRCVNTVEPLARRIGVDVELSDALREGASPGRIADLCEEVAGTTAVLCSHGDVIPEMLRYLAGRGMRLDSPFECKKASTWALVYDGAYRSGVYLPPPAA